MADTAPEPVRSHPDIDFSRPHVMLRLVSAEQRAVRQFMTLECDILIRRHRIDAFIKVVVEYVAHT